MTQWNPDPLIVVPLVVLAYAYGRGVQSLWRAAGPGRGIPHWQTLAFGGALATLAIALLSPLDVLADTLFSAHMAQHLLLVVVAAPLLALGAPEIALLWALTRRQRVQFGAAAHRLHWLRVLAILPVAFGVHSTMLWAWHAPPLYEAALTNTAIHFLEHASLLGSGFLFWSGAFTGLRRGGRGLLAAFLYVFLLGAQCTGLGALITLSHQPWYPRYASLDDQVLAGVLMWVPAGVLYLGYGLALLAAWLQPNSAVSGAGGGPHYRQRSSPPGAPEWRRTT